MQISEIHAKIAQLAADGKYFAIITIIRAYGSSPRGVGAKMIALEEGMRIGTIGGDCLENDAVDEAVRLIGTDKKMFGETGTHNESATKVLTMLLDEEESGGVGMLCGGKVDVLIEVIRPQLQLVILGSGPVAMSIIHLADFVDITSTLVDPIEPRERVPISCTFVKARHEEGLEKLKVTDSTAIILVTRHKNDIPSLTTSLTTKAGYIGMIGSKHRVQTILNRVGKTLNIKPQAIGNRVHAPIGLDIGASTPSELAISILAEILTFFRKGSGMSKALYIPVKQIQSRKH
ncbi:MAG: XdhC family protein [Thaumarchaeota archaeon]|nr:XdhC family protein [Nitrososphaerota archaeon]